MYSCHQFRGCVFMRVTLGHTYPAQEQWVTQIANMSTTFSPIPELTFSFSRPLESRGFPQHFALAKIPPSCRRNYYTAAQDAAVVPASSVFIQHLTLAALKQMYFLYSSDWTLIAHTRYQEAKKIEKDNIRFKYFFILKVRLKQSNIAVFFCFEAQHCVGSS